MIRIGLHSIAATALCQSGVAAIESDPIWALLYPSKFDTKMPQFHLFFGRMRLKLVTPIVQHQLSTQYYKPVAGNKGHARLKTAAARPPGMFSPYKSRRIVR